MKAIVQDEYGSADILELRDIDKPVVWDHDVILRVDAPGGSPGVWQVMTGQPYLLRILGYGLLRPRINDPGADVAGRIKAVGRNMNELVDEPESTA